MQPFDLIKRLFHRPKPLICGGEACCKVVDNLGFAVAWLWYKRPDSDMRLSYIYDMQAVFGSEEKLKRINKAENKPKECHEMIMRDVSVPYAEKIFIRSEGFRNEQGRPIEGSGGEFQYLSKYYAHCLVDMAALAYQAQGIVKKNS